VRESACSAVQGLGHPPLRRVHRLPGHPGVDVRPPGRVRDGTQGEDAVGLLEQRLPGHSGVDIRVPGRVRDVSQEENSVGLSGQILS